MPLRPSTKPTPSAFSISNANPGKPVLIGPPGWQYGTHLDGIIPLIFDTDGLRTHHNFRPLVL